MLRPCLIVALAAMSAIAAEPKFGLIVEGLLPRTEAPSPLESSLGFGGLIAIEGRFDVSEKVAIAPFVGFEYIMHGVEAERNGEKAELTLKSRFVPIGAGIQIGLTPELRLAVTPEIDLSMGGTGKVSASDSESGESYESDEEDIEDEESPFLLGFGIVYGSTDKSALLLGYKLATGDYFEDYKLHKFYLGGRFEL